MCRFNIGDHVRTIKGPANRLVMTVHSYLPNDEVLRRLNNKHGVLAMPGHFMTQYLRCEYQSNDNTIREVFHEDDLELVQ